MGCGLTGYHGNTQDTPRNEDWTNMSGNLGVPQFPAMSSPQRAGGGKPRNKVALKPGRSLMDWIRLSKSKDLSGTGARILNVTPEELAKHDKEGDAWTAIRGKVYNVTAYVEYHPGGGDELMRAAGKDGTELFNEVHRWVNYESMLESCLVGRLRQTFHVSPNAAAQRRPPRVQTGFLKPPLPASLQLPKAQPLKGPLDSTTDLENTSKTESSGKSESTGQETVAIRAPEFVKPPLPANLQLSKVQPPKATLDSTTENTSNMENTNETESSGKSESTAHETVTVNAPQIVHEENETVDSPVVPVPFADWESPRHDWFQSDKYITIAVYTKRKGLAHENVLLDKNGREFHLRLVLGQHQYNVHVELEDDVTDDISVSFGASGSKVEVKLKKATAGRKWTMLGAPLGMNSQFVGVADCQRHYRQCVVESREEVTHDTTLFGLRFPPGSRMWVPAGHHVYVRCEVDGVGSVERPYTPVPASLLPAQVSPRCEEGSYTPVPTSVSPVQSESAQVARCEEGRGLCLMVKVYPQGTLTPVVGRLQPGKRLEVSDYDATLALPSLDEFTSVAFVVAGTGFTPVPGLVTQLLAREDRDVNVTVVFFNKQERDILWRDQLERLARQQVQRVKVVHVLSDPGVEWAGRTGRIRREVVEDVLPAPGPGAMVLVCGPVPFNQAAVEVLREIGYQDSMYYVF